MQRVHIELAWTADRVASVNWPFLDLNHRCAKVPCCDKITVVVYDAVELETVRGRIVRAFSDVGFGTHDIPEARYSATVRGADFGGAKHCVCVHRSIRKLRVLQHAFSWLASGATVSGRWVEVLLVQFVAAAMFFGRCIHTCKIVTWFLENYGTRVPARV